MADNSGMVMTRSRSVIWAVLFALAQQLGTSAQVADADPLVSADIMRIIGSDADARTVIAKVLTLAMADRRRELLLANQIRSEWLPVAKGVDFVRLPDSEIRGVLSSCGSYWVIVDLERTQNVVTMGLHHKCGGTGLGYRASFDGSEWQVRPTWVGGGIPTPQPDCPCLGR